MARSRWAHAGPAPFCPAPFCAALGPRYCNVQSDPLHAHVNGPSHAWLSLLCLGAAQSENEKLKEELENAVDQGGGGSARSSSEVEHELKELHAEFTRRLGAADKTVRPLPRD